MTTLTLRWLMTHPHPQVVDDYVAVMDVPMLTVEGIRRAMQRLIPEGSTWEQVWVGRRKPLGEFVCQTGEQLLITSWHV